MPALEGSASGEVQQQPFFRRPAVRGLQRARHLAPQRVGQQRILTHLLWEHTLGQPGTNTTRKVRPRASSAVPTKTLP